MTIDVNHFFGMSHSSTCQLFNKNFGKFFGKSRQLSLHTPALVADVNVRNMYNNNLSSCFIVSLGISPPRTIFYLSIKTFETESVSGCKISWHPITFVVTSPRKYFFLAKQKDKAVPGKEMSRCVRYI